MFNFRSSKSSSGQESGSFSQRKNAAFFNEYASPEDPEVIGPEGIEALCNGMAVKPEDPVMLVLAYKMEAKQMGYFTRKEWNKGMTELQADSMTKLRSRVDALRALLYDSHSFKHIFRYAFDFSKDQDQRCLDIETAKGMLTLLLAPTWPLLPYLMQFLEEENRYRVMNKDQWFNVLEFARTVSPDLGNYDEDGAWPVLLDEFVTWFRKHRQQQQQQQQQDQQTQLTSDRTMVVMTSAGGGGGGGGSPDHQSPCDSPVNERSLRRKRRLCNNDKD